MDALKRVRAHLIVDLLREGWRPPPLKPAQADRLVDDLAHTDGRRRIHLAPAQLEVLRLTAEGLTADEIAAKTHRSSETVRAYRKQIQARLSARNGTHSVAIAIRERIIA